MKLLFTLKAARRSLHQALLNTRLRLSEFRQSTSSLLRHSVIQAPADSTHPTTRGVASTHLGEFDVCFLHAKLL